ncbi:MAG TPA: SDR family oxidoreductase, partial [Symbiobacteriaceae bacterium]|nr:SDR family oxidoreductase [Symbiobacteriaceae bacterium]
MTEEAVVLITGTSRGIGQALVQHYVALGCQVVGCSRGASTLDLPGYTHHQVDVTDEAAVARMMREVARSHGRLDVLVNNAGIAAMNHALTTPGATAERLMATNFLGAFHVAKAGAKLMIPRRYGRIINLSTVAVPLRLEGESLYAASKSALLTFTQVLAKEVARFGITCNVVGPGP